MITANEVANLNLPIQANDAKSCLLIENALNWINDNTTISINMNDLSSVQANVKLFIIEYIDIMKLPIGVTSESATGLSQSFNTTDKSELILSLARSIFSDDVLTAGKVKFVAANERWSD